MMLVLLTIVDALLLYRIANGIGFTRELPEKLSNGDANQVELLLHNYYNFKVFLEIIEELPFQFQKRDFIFKQQLKTNQEKHISYSLTPTKRGGYNFGKTNVYTASPLRLVVKKMILGEEKNLKCYPSFLKLKELDFKAAGSLSLTGTKKTRRLGHSLEFEQIKEYIPGDDYRTINWKATAKTNQLMVNQFIEEKSQSIYSIIDKGRVMEMSFNGLTLLDYAINTSLAMSSMVLRKHDRAGMLTFSNKIEDVVVAEQRNSQMRLISDALYKVTTDFSESDYSLLYATVKKKITNRSLLILYTNFETLDSLERQLPYLKALAKNHLVLVVFFKNTELDKVAKKRAGNDIKKVYDKIIAEKFKHDKKRIVNELRKYGIHSVLTAPENLTSATINQYLDFKSRGYI